MYREIPPRRSGYSHQEELSSISDSEFTSLFIPPKYSKLQKFFQVLTFVLFFGYIKIVIALFFFILFFILVLVLPYIKPFFLNNKTFKSFCHIILQPTVRLMFFGMGIVHINVSGKMHPDCRYIVANNLALIDSILLFTLFPMSLVCNDSLTSNYFIKRIRYVLDLIFVDASKTPNITQALLEFASDPSYLPVVVFPEFRPTNGNKILKFEPVAFASEYYVQPVTIRYRMWLTHLGKNTICELYDSWIMNLWGLFSTPFITVDVSFLDPQYWKETDKILPTVRAEQTQLLIANDLSVPAVDRSGASAWIPKQKLE